MSFEFVYLAECHWFAESRQFIPPCVEPKVASGRIWLFPHL